MLTLSQMADYITGKLGQFDDTSVALCKTFIAARYKMVYDAYFWRDSQMTGKATLSAGQDVFTYPDGMERIVTIRAGSDQFLDPVTESFLIESDPTIFDRTGTPQFYSEVRNAIDQTGAADLVRVYPAPDVDTGFYIFGKHVCPQLTDDNGVSVLRNCDNVIMAFATADFLERQRQYAKAQQKFQEANALLEEAKSVEKDQANRPRTSKQITVSGNSLSEMVDAVCAITGQWTPDMVILVRDFVRRNYVSLYDLAIWPEGTVAVRTPYLQEQVILPDYIDRVIAVRGGDLLPLFPSETSLFFNIDPFVFESMGTAASFSMLTPVGVAVLPPSAPEQLVFASTDPNDSGKKIFVRGESAGLEITEEVTLSSPSTAPVKTHFLYDVPLTVAKPVTAGYVTVNGNTSFTSLEILYPNEREKKHQRIWLLPPPSAAALANDPTVLILGKRKIKPLLSNEDTPIITGAQ